MKNIEWSKVFNNNNNANITSGSFDSTYNITSGSSDNRININVLKIEKPFRYKKGKWRYQGVVNIVKETNTKYHFSTTYTDLKQLITTLKMYISEKVLDSFDEFTKNKEHSMFARSNKRHLTHLEPLIIFFFKRYVVTTIKSEKKIIGDKLSISEVSIPNNNNNNKIVKLKGKFFPGESINVSINNGSNNNSVKSVRLIMRIEFKITEKSKPAWYWIYYDTNGDIDYFPENNTTRVLPHLNKDDLILYYQSNNRNNINKYWQEGTYSVNKNITRIIPIKNGNTPISISTNSIIPIRKSPEQIILDKAKISNVELGNIRKKLGIRDDYKIQSTIGNETIPLDAIILMKPYSNNSKKQYHTGGGCIFKGIIRNLINLIVTIIIIATAVFIAVAAITAVGAAERLGAGGNVSSLGNAVNTVAGAISEVAKAGIHITGKIAEFAFQPIDGVYKVDSGFIRPYTVFDAFADGLSTIDEYIIRDTQGDPNIRYIKINEVEYLILSIKNDVIYLIKKDYKLTSNINRQIINRQIIQIPITVLKKQGGGSSKHRTSKIINKNDIYGIPEAEKLIVINSRDKRCRIVKRTSKGIEEYVNINGNVLQDNPLLLRNTKNSNPVVTKNDMDNTHNEVEKYMKQFNYHKFETYQIEYIRSEENNNIYKIEERNEIIAYIIVNNEKKKVMIDTLDAIIQQFTSDQAPASDEFVETLYLDKFKKLTKHMKTIMSKLCAEFLEKATEEQKIELYLKIYIIIYSDIETIVSREGIINSIDVHNKHFAGGAGSNAAAAAAMAKGTAAAGLGFLHGATAVAGFFSGMGGIAYLVIIFVLFTWKCKDDPDYWKKNSAWYTGELLTKKMFSKDLRETIKTKLGNGHTTDSGI
jgi:hypothetical protein